MSKIQRFEKNRNGRDFVVGDIHGEFSKLERQLEELGFDKSSDRLFSVGDLVDRGPESDEAVYYVMRRPWFHAVKGNHEQMLVDALNPELPNAAGNHFINGGQWFYGLPEVEQQCIAVVLDDLPIAIEVETDAGLVGIIHAEVPYGDWNEFKLDLETNEPYTEEIAMWSRKKIMNGDCSYVLGIDFVYVGHTPVKRVLELGNVTYIDTGAVFEHPLAIIQIQ